MKLEGVMITPSSFTLQVPLDASWVYIHPPIRYRSSIETMRSYPRDKCNSRDGPRLCPNGVASGLPIVDSANA